MVFLVGVLPYNPDGWGPADAPAAPFSSSSFAAPLSTCSSVFDFALDESAVLAVAADGETSFRLVDRNPPPRPTFGPRWRFQQLPQKLPQRRDEGDPPKKRNNRRSGPDANNNRRRDSPSHKSSVDIQPEWTMLEQIPFSTFTKLSFAVPDPPEDLLQCGSLEFYDRFSKRITPKSERRLERFKTRNFFKVTTTDDPVIRRLASEDRATVFATDAILSTLMCAPRSVISWDMVIQRVGNKLFFDKRAGSQLDLLSVNETGQEPLPEAKEDINSAHSLAMEATFINQNFSQHVLVRNGNKATFDEPNPFVVEGEEEASVAYRYRRWKLDDDMYLIARCEMHAVSAVKGQKSYMTLNALNEFDTKYTGIDWRQKLEMQWGAVLATELKNNANRIAKWTAQALLANADLMTLGYVSRVQPRDHLNHVILRVTSHKPKDFASQINLNTSNMWGIVKLIVDVCMKLNEGKYVLVKDPAKPHIRIYEVPADAFENDYMEEPLPEEEQVKIMDEVAKAEANTAADA